jgi:hypothetical protein
VDAQLAPALNWQCRSPAVKFDERNWWAAHYRFALTISTFDGDDSLHSETELSPTVSFY